MRAFFLNLSKDDIIVNNTASISSLGELVLVGVIWFAVRKLIDSNIFAKANQLAVYSIIRHFVIFTVKVVHWQSESYISEVQYAYETNISQS